MKEFGDNLKLYRERAGISRKKMCDDFKMSLPTLGQYERGGREPDLSRLRDIAAYLHVSIDQLLGYDPEKVSSTDHYVQQLQLYGCIVDCNNDTITVDYHQDHVQFTIAFSAADFLAKMRRIDQHARSSTKILVDLQFQNEVMRELALLALKKD